MTAFWLVKSEPDAFSWAQQVERGVEPWTGVRSHAAANNLRAMRLGDRAFFYHSNVGKEVVGVVEVVRESYPDPTVDLSEGKKGEWVCVDMRAVGPMPRAVTLAQMKEDPVLDGFLLLRQSRLSVVPVSPEHWRHICKLGDWKEPKR
jgi:predicted RNA-binding protein with PUA-like domain